MLTRVAAGLIFGIEPGIKNNRGIFENGQKIKPVIIRHELSCPFRQSSRSRPVIRILSAQAFAAMSSLSFGGTGFFPRAQ